MPCAARGDHAKTLDARPSPYRGRADVPCIKHALRIKSTNGNSELTTSRGSASERGYDKRWERARKVFLAEHPMCADCLRRGWYTPATVVDHIVPHKGDQDLFWDDRNWQPLCKACHDRKTARRGRRIREQTQQLMACPHRPIKFSIGRWEPWRCLGCVKSSPISAYKIHEGRRRPCPTPSKDIENTRKHWTNEERSAREQAQQQLERKFGATLAAPRIVTRRPRCDKTLARYRGSDEGHHAPG